jgi:hypothetical protein
MYRIAWPLLLAGCVPASSITAPPELPEPRTYVARPLHPNNCGTPDRPTSCEQRRPQREQEGRIIWNPEPFYPIIQEPLPDLTPLTRLKWPDER